MLISANFNDAGKKCHQFSPFYKNKLTNIRKVHFVKRERNDCLIMQGNNPNGSVTTILTSF